MAMRSRRARSKVFPAFPRASNEELLASCMTGDQEAWSQLIDKYERLVYAITRREGCDEEMAHDVTQETFSHLLKSIESIKDPESLGRWLATVCRREIWRRQSSSSHNESEFREDLVAPTPDFVDRYILSADVYEAVQSLPELCRSLIFGLFFDPNEPDYAGLAVQLGRPVGSIGPLRGRCLDQLRTIMEARSR